MGDLGQEPDFEHPEVMAAVHRARTQCGLTGIEPLGLGGRSLLYTAIHPWGQVTLKVPRYGCETPGEWWVLENNLLKEAHVLQALQSARIPRLVCINSRGEFLVREYFQGRNLDLLAREDVEPTLRLHWIIEILALARECFPLLHEHPGRAYVIRDLKPRNCVLEAPWALLRLIDLGSVRPEDDMVGSHRSRPRAGTGKWLCWPPEQLLESRTNCDRRVDYFALGASCYYALFATYPYTNKEDDPKKALEAYSSEYTLCSHAFQRVLENVGFPDTWLSFLTRTLNPVPADRASTLPKTCMPTMGPPRSVLPDVTAAAEPYVEGLMASAELASFKSVICLRRQTPAWWEKATHTFPGTRFIHLPVPACGQDGFAEAFGRAADVALRAPRPTIFFCLRGQNRSGMLAAAIHGLERHDRARALWEYRWCAGEAHRVQEIRFVKCFLVAC